MKRPLCLVLLLLGCGMSASAQSTTPLAWPVDKIITRTFISEQHQELLGPHERLPRRSEFRQEQTAVLETASRPDRLPGRDLRLSFTRIRLKIAQDNEPTLNLDSERVEDRVHPAMGGWRVVKDVALIYRQDPALSAVDGGLRLLRATGFPGQTPPAQLTDPLLYQPFLSPSSISSFPQGPLRKGTTWQEKRLQVLPSIGQVQAELRFTVEGSGQTNGFPIIRIQIQGDLRTTDESLVPEQLTFVGGRLHGEVFFSEEWGMDMHHRLTQEMNFESPHPVVGGVVKTKSTLTHSMLWGGMRDRENLPLKGGSVPVMR